MGHARFTACMAAKKLVEMELRMAPFYHQVSLCSDRSSGASMDAKHSLEHF